MDGKWVSRYDREARITYYTDERRERHGMRSSTRLFEILVFLVSRHERVITSSTSGQSLAGSCFMLTTELTTWKGLKKNVYTRTNSRTKWSYEKKNRSSISRTTREIWKTRIRYKIWEQSGICEHEKGDVKSGIREHEKGEVNYEISIRNTLTQPRFELSPIGKRISKAITSKN